MSNSCHPVNCSPPGSSVHGDSPGKKTGVGCHALLQGIFPNQGLNPGLPHCRRILYHLSHEGSPRILEWVAYHFSRRSSWLRNQNRVSCIAGGFFTSWATREAKLSSLGEVEYWWSFLPAALVNYLLRELCKPNCISSHPILSIPFTHSAPGLYELVFSRVPYKWNHTARILLNPALSTRHTVTLLWESSLLLCVSVICSFFIYEWYSFQLVRGNYLYLFR